MIRKGKRKLIPAIALAALVAASPAAAGVRISSVDTSSYPSVRVTVVAPLGAAQPQLREDGLPVYGLEAANLGRAKSVVVAVDRSESMRGRSLRDAVAAAQTFVGAKQPGDRVEVLAFGRYAIGLTKFSTAATDAQAALAGIAPDAESGTALWDAVVRAANALQREQQPGRVIVVVTDGADVSSTATLESAVAAAQRARAEVYAIGIAGHDFTAAPLRELAERTGGLFLEASSSAELTALYARIDDALAHTWQLSYSTAARPGDDLKLTTIVPGSGNATRDVTVSASGLTGAAAGKPSVLPAHIWQSTLAPLVLALTVGLIILLAFTFANAARSGSWLKSRLAPHLATAQPGRKVKRARQQHSVRRTVVGATERAFANVKQFKSLQRLLTRADLPLVAAELLYICLGCAFLVGVLAAALSVPSFMVLILLVGAGAAPIAYVMMLASRREKAFDNQLPDLLISIAASLKAGHSFRHAIQAVVEEGADPAAKEFRRVLNETRLGRPMDAALAEMSERVGSKNLTFVLNTVTIQRQIGGGLAGLFDMVAETVRQRQQFARKIRSLTATGRMSAYVLGGLPFAVALLINLINPGYMSPLWHTGTGHLLVGTALGMIGFGGVILRKIVSFKG